uniref:Lysozyme M1 n=1 Tax=Sipha flava TaxID=143950 RepID=A0A2S2Q6Y2_9HEMI
MFDPQYRTYQRLAEKEGLLWGAYHFGTKANGVMQAKHFLSKVGNTSKTLLVLDIEPYKNKIMTQNQAEDFIKTVQKIAGSVIMIYGSYNTLNNYSTPFLRNIPLWIAYYNTQLKIPFGWDKWVLWQYTNGIKGPWPHEVIGIGLCDRDIFNGSVDKLKAFWPNGSSNF